MYMLESIALAVLYAALMIVIIMITLPKYLSLLELFEKCYGNKHRYHALFKRHSKYIVKTFISLILWCMVATPIFIALSWQLGKLTLMIIRRY